MIFYFIKPYIASNIFVKQKRGYLWQVLPYLKVITVFSLDIQEIAMLEIYENSFHIMK